MNGNGPEKGKLIKKLCQVISKTPNALDRTVCSTLRDIAGFFHIDTNGFDELKDFSIEKKRERERALAAITPEVVLDPYDDSEGFYQESFKTVDFFPEESMKRDVCQFQLPSQPANSISSKGSGAFSVPQNLLPIISKHGTFHSPCNGSILSGGPAFELEVPCHDIRYSWVRGNVNNPSPSFFIGGRKLSEETNQFIALRAGTLMIGKTGSGKSVSMESLMREAFKNVAMGSRMLLLDCKDELLPKLRVLNRLFGPVRILNFDPFALQEEAAQWDIKREIGDDIGQCKLIARHLLPPPKDKQTSEFFIKGPRDYLQKVLEALSMEKNVQWDFLDVVTCLLRRDAGDALISKTAEGRDWVKRNRSERNRDLELLMGQLYDYFIPTATKWREKPDVPKVTFKDWGKYGGAILLLPTVGESETYLSAGFASLAANVTTERPNVPDESTEDLTWVFLDELQNLPKIEHLSKLISKGRSRGAATIIGTQSIVGLYSTYGVLEGKIISGVANMCLFNLDGDSYRFVVDTLGYYEFREKLVSRNFSSSSSEVAGGTPTSGSTQSISENFVTTRRPVIDQEKCNMGTLRDCGLPMYSYVRGFKNHRLWRTTLPPEEVEIIKIEVPPDQERIYSSRKKSTQSMNFDLKDFVKKFSPS